MMRSFLFRSNYHTGGETAICIEEVSILFSQNHESTYSTNWVTPRFFFNTSWRGVWRRYEMMRRMDYQRKRSSFIWSVSLSAFWARFNAWWLGIDPYYRCIAPLVGLNVLVFLLWRVPQCSIKMSRTFLALPISSKVSSLCVSVSAMVHFSFPHFLIKKRGTS